VPYDRRTAERKVSPETAPDLINFGLDLIVLGVGIGVAIMAGGVGALGVWAGVPMVQDEKKFGKASSRILGYSIWSVGLALLFVTFNYTVDIPYFQNMRASPVFLIFGALCFWWIKKLFLMTPAGLAPLITTQLLALIINFALKILFTDNIRSLGFTSKILFYLAAVSSVISIILILAFLLSARRFIRKNHSV
jgi:hypothetical protein